MIVFDCPKCGRKMQAAEDVAGKRVRCPGCQEVVWAPEARKKAPSQPREEPEDEPEVAPRRSAPAREAEVEETEDESRRPCPMCGELIVADALKCRFCGEIFDPALKRAKKKKKRGRFVSDDELEAGDIALAIILSGIGCIVGIIWMIQGKPKGTKMFLISLIMTVIWTAISLMIEGL